MVRVLDRLKRILLGPSFREYLEKVLDEQDQITRIMTMEIIYMDDVDTVDTVSYSPSGDIIVYDKLIELLASGDKDIYRYHSLKIVDFINEYMEEK